MSPGGYNLKKTEDILCYTAGVRSSNGLYRDLHLNSLTDIKKLGQWEPSIIQVSRICENPKFVRKVLDQDRCFKLFSAKKWSPPDLTINDVMKSRF